jgi:hypothetical protein
MDKITKLKKDKKIIKCKCGHPVYNNDIYQDIFCYDSDKKKQIIHISANLYYCAICDNTWIDNISIG